MDGQCTYEVQEKTENNTGRQTNTHRCIKCATTASGLCFDKHINTVDQLALIHTSSCLKHVVLLHTLKLAERGIVDILLKRCPKPLRCSLAVKCEVIAMLH